MDFLTNLYLTIFWGAGSKNKEKLYNFQWENDFFYRNEMKLPNLQKYWLRETFDGIARGAEHKELSNVLVINWT